MAGRGGKAAVTAAQMRKIHVLAREYGLDDDLLHVHIQTVTGKDSLRKLSLGEAVRVIDSLDQKADQMTWRQKYFIDRLLQELGWTDGQGQPDYNRLDGFCSKYYGVDSHKWITRRNASNVIEGLKNMARKEGADRKAAEGTAGNTAGSAIGDPGGGYHGKGQTDQKA